MVVVNPKIPLKISSGLGSPGCCGWTWNTPERVTVWVGAAGSLVLTVSIPRWSRPDVALKVMSTSRLAPEAIVAGRGWGGGAGKGSGGATGGMAGGAVAGVWERGG